MKPFHLLRAASVLSFLFALGHTLGGSDSWSPVGETDVLRAMRTFRFDAAGSSRTYLDFFLGFGFCLSVYLLLQGVLLWQIATIAKTDPARVRPLVVSVLVATIANAIISWRFIFVIPVVCGVAIAVCLAAALFLGGRRATV